jgi:4-amino-4-deoxy-L-arabinose transferase-like glycosyltransferase
MNYRARHLHYLLSAFTLILGAFQAWVGRHAMTADGVSYLDMADAILRGDGRLTINGHWSPLYPWLLAAARRLLKPDSYGMFAVTHLLNFLIFCALFGSFQFFWRQLRDYEAAQGRKDSRDGWVTLPGGFHLVLVYSLFIWLALRLIPVALVTPDMCMAVFVLLACGFLLRVRMGRGGWTSYALLGLALGFGYLAKAPIFPLAWVFLATSLFGAPSLRKAVPGVLIASAVFLAVSAPLIVALSIKEGRPSFGDSARLNYAWHINGTAWVHWQGDTPPGVGIPKHPERKIFSHPAVYEFATPIQGTYPPWFDPVYWNEGITPHFELRNQLKVLAHNARIYLELFLKGGLAPVVLIFFLAFVKPSQRRWWLGHIGKAWFLLVPVLAGMGMFAPVHVEMRYIGSFIFVFWVTLLAAIRLPDSRQVARLAQVLMAIPMVSLLAISLISTDHYLRADARHVDETNQRVAHWLTRNGTGPGDWVALIGFGREAYWARLARLRIVAEMPTENAEKFWDADSALRSQVIDAFERTGAKILVAEKVPPSAPLAGWTRIDQTDCYAFRLQGEAMPPNLR